MVMFFHMVRNIVRPPPDGITYDDVEADLFRTKQAQHLRKRAKHGYKCAAFIDWWPSACMRQQQGVQCPAHLSRPPDCTSFLAISKYLFNAGSPL